MPETIKALHQKGIELTIASSRSHQTLDAYVRDLQLGEYIQYILGVEDVKDAKPGPGPVLKTLKDFGRQPEECIVVGDTKYDIQMAHNAGVKAVGVTYGNGSRKEMEEENTKWMPLLHGGTEETAEKEKPSRRGFLQCLNRAAWNGGVFRFRGDKSEIAGWTQEAQDLCLFTVRCLFL